VNYFAHAHVARLVRADPRFVLGAMLPDFASMIGLRFAGVRDPALRDGVRLHERTDAAFHTAPAFAALYREGIEALESRGLARGPARGAAHVGLELLLDGTLVGEAPTARAYLAALGAAREREIQRAIGWTSQLGVHRWPWLCARLEDQGVPHAYRDPASVARRVRRALQRRPRLRLAPGDEARVADWLHGLRPRLVEARATLVAETLTRGPGVTGSREAHPCATALADRDARAGGSDPLEPTPRSELGW
jgi:acyl carrier protein phosphodiesterase